MLVAREGVLYRLSLWASPFVTMSSCVFGVKIWTRLTFFSVTAHHIRVHQLNLLSKWGRIHMARVVGAALCPPAPRHAAAAATALASRSASQTLPA